MIYTILYKDNVEVKTWIMMSFILEAEMQPGKEDGF